MTEILMLLIAAIIVTAVIGAVRAIATDGYGRADRRDALREFDRPARA